jgi:hypothetical protein
VDDSESYSMSGYGISGVETSGIKFESKTNQASFTGKDWQRRASDKPLTFTSKNVG